MATTNCFPSLSADNNGLNIRLLDLESCGSPPNEEAQDKQPILRDTLRVVSLNEKPEYTALSYVWGEPSEKHSIVLEGRSLNITRNCFDALLDFRTRFGTTSIWVDSICINQKAVQEVNQQVKIMGEIYSRAETVYVWFDTSPPEITMDFVKALRRLAVDRTDWYGRYNTETLTLHRFFEHQIFYRAWTIQELVLAKRPVFASSLGMIHWEEVLLAVKRLSTESWHHPGQYGLVHLVSLWRSIHSEGHTLSIQSLIEVFTGAMRRRKVSNTQDQIYAYYGVLQKLGIPLTELDYTRKLEKIQYGFFVDLLRWNSLFLALLADSGKTHEGSECSWIPRWYPFDGTEEISGLWDRPLRYGATDPDWVPDSLVCGNTASRLASDVNDQSQPWCEILGSSLHVRVIMHDNIISNIRCREENSFSVVRAREQRLRRDPFYGQHTICSIIKWVRHMETLLGVDVKVAATNIARMIISFAAGGSQWIGGRKISNQDIIAWTAMLEKGIRINLEEAARAPFVFSYVKDVHKTFSTCLEGKRSLVVTERQGYGISPFMTEEKDVICRIDGVPNMMVIRRQESGAYKVIGPILIDYVGEESRTFDKEDWQQIELV
jgi:hypothetical protein